MSTTAIILGCIALGYVATLAALTLALWVLNQKEDRAQAEARTKAEERATVERLIRERVNYAGVWAWEGCTTGTEYRTTSHDSGYPMPSGLAMVRSEGVG